MKFSDIETISQGVSDYLSDNKIVDMTEIQRQTYKHIMDNRDINVYTSDAVFRSYRRFYYLKDNLIRPER